MEIEQLLNATLLINLISSSINVLAYAYWYYKISKIEVDGHLRLTRITILFEFLSILMVAVLLTIVFRTVLFDPGRLNEALYLLNFTMLLFNVAFNANALLLFLIVKKATR